ncbi:hypothetical protein Tco_0244064, partial [Tanacetum coccineum]
MNGWIEADVPLLEELGKMGEPLGAEVEEQMVALVVDMEEDLAVLFGDEDFSDDGPDDEEDDEEVWEVNEEWLMAPVTPLSMPVMAPSSTYEVGGSSTAAAEGHPLTLLAPRLVKKVIMVSDAKVADSIAIGEIGPRVSTVEGQMQVMASQMVQVVSGLEQVRAHVEQGQQATTQKDEMIAGLSQQV